MSLGGVSSASLLSRSPAGVGQGLEYTGQAPAVGTDSMENPAPANLNVVGAIYDLSFRPVVSGSGGLPADWLDGIRVDVEPVAGTVIRVGAPSFDAQLGLGHVTIEVDPASGSDLQDGLKLRITVRSRVELQGDENDFDNQLNSPDIRRIWITPPPVVDRPKNPGLIGTGIQTTTLTGRVNDPRVREVQVTLFYSLDRQGNQESAMPLAGSGLPALDIPVPVRPDGTWSVDIAWDPSELPSGDLWIYGMVDDGNLHPPVFGASAGPFQVVRSIDRRLPDPQRRLSDTLQQGMSGPGLVLAGPDGLVHRVSTDDQGGYKVPVAAAGVETVTRASRDATASTDDRLRLRGTPAKRTVAVNATAPSTPGFMPSRSLPWASSRKNRSRRSIDGWAWTRDCPGHQARLRPRFGGSGRRFSKRVRFPPEHKKTRCHASPGRTPGGPPNE